MASGFKGRDRGGTAGWGGCVLAEVVVAHVKKFHSRLFTGRDTEQCQSRWPMWVSSVQRESTF
jgi:hypothetical protein